MKTALFLISALFIFNLSFGSAILGGALSLNNIGSDTYQTKVVLLNDCAGAAAPDSVLVYYQCMGQNNLSYSKYIHMLTSSGYEVVDVHDTSITSCNGGNSLGYKEYKYEGYSNLNSTHHWKIYISIQGRAEVNSCYTNASQNFYLESNLYLNLASNSNVSYNSPLSRIFTDYPNSINIVNWDIDGDSLSFELVNPLTDSITPVNYKPQFSANNFIPSSTPITIDAITGDIHFNATVEFTAITKMKITEWRLINGQMQIIGNSQFDLLFHSYNVINNPPVLSGMDFDLKDSYSALDTIYSKEFYVGDTIKFRIHAYDIDSGLNSNCSNASDIYVTVDSTDINFADISVINDYTDSVYIEFEWVPTSSDISSSPYNLFIKVEDHWRSYLNSGRNYFQYEITIKEPVSISNTTKENNIKIYPNPAHSQISLLFEEEINNIEVIIFDIIGNQIYYNKYSNSKEIKIAVGDFAKGSYFIKVMSDNKTVKTEKLIIL